MAESIHGHEVMKMMISSGKTFTKETLEAMIYEQFGVDARFHTCSAEDMTAKELIDFLEDRGKFMGAEGGFSTDPGNICDDES